MDSKWKMLKAFARALEGPEAVEKRLSGDKFIKEIDKRAHDVSRDAIADNDFKAFEATRAGRRGGFDDNEGIPKSRVDVNNNITKIPASERQAAFDDLSDFETDSKLKGEFERAFDEAAENHGYKKWKEESKDMPLDDGFRGDLHDVNREDAVQRSREEIIKALQQNTDRDVTDVLRDFGYIFEE